VIFSAFQRVEFLNLLLFLTLLSIYFLNYFEQTVVKLAIAQTVAGLGWDILWLALLMGRWSDPPDRCEHHRWDHGWMMFSLVVTFFLMPIKLAILLILCRWRQPQPRLVSVCCGKSVRMTGIFSPFLK
jgi:hypothetical protein